MSMERYSFIVCLDEKYVDVEDGVNGDGIGQEEEKQVSHPLV